MTRSNNILFLILFLFLTGTIKAHGGEGHGDPYVGSKEFERMKKLTGVWEGTSTWRGEQKSVRVMYRLTAGGSAIVETLFPGTPEEMISVYHEEEGKLTMTHYCMLKNQPRMELIRADDESLDFLFAGGNDIDPVRDSHMHSLTITYSGDDRIVQRWTMYEGGEEKGMTTLTLNRSE